MPSTLYLINANTFLMNRLLLCLMGLMPGLAWGQSTSDCDGAIVLCGDVYSETEASFNTGAVYEYTGACNNFLEQSSIWYTFTVYEDGLLSFVLDPLDPIDDYDWGLFDVTEGGCAGIGATTGVISPEVGCNSWGTAFGENGGTGISSANGGTGNSNGPGDLNGPPFNADLPVTQGSTYALVVMNWSNSTNGYTIDFGQSTAVLYDQEPPTLLSMDSTGCEMQEFVVTFSEPLVTGTVETEDFVLMDPSGNALSFESVNANVPGNTCDNFTLSLSSPLTQSGLHVLEITEDALFVEDPCGNSGVGSLEKDFLVLQPPVGWDEHVVEGCQGEPVLLIPTMAASQPSIANMDFVWSSGTGGMVDTLGVSSSLVVQEEGYYHVLMSTNPACYEAEGSFLVELDVCGITIPNVITPFSSLGSNDRFFIKGLDAFPEATVEIFNRWGQLVYESSDYGQTAGWDPREHGASSGLYQYILRLPNLPIPLIVSDQAGLEVPFEGEAPAVFQGTITVMD